MGKVQTIARGKKTDEKLENIVGRLELGFKPLNFGLGNTIKFATFSTHPEPYLIIISQSTIDNSPLPYNTIITTTSENHKLNNKLYGYITRNMRARTIELHETYKKLLETGMNSMFEDLKVRGEEAFELLSRLKL